MILWMKVTDDRYELPELIADSAIELADMCGVSKKLRIFGKLTVSERSE